MLWLYRILFFPALLVLSPGYLWRMWRRGGYGSNFSQRFGGHPPFPAKPPGARRVWLQAVSVGEMLAIGPILEGLARDGVQVYLTTTTSTGYRLANERYRALVMAIGYFPLDWWAFSARAWRGIGPDLAILTEGERWPEHVHQGRRRGVPLINLNARVSDLSFRRLKACRRWLPGVPRLLLGGMARLLACSQQDADRFLELGFPGERMRVTGNIKLDVTIARLSEVERAALRGELGLPAGLLLLGSSTWPGEEAALLQALLAARADGVRCSLLLVPRHAERRAEIEAELRASGLRAHFRSRGRAPGEVDVSVADTTGELQRLTQLADLVFVGKSLPPHTAGQTPVEAAILGKPLLFGPGMGNFAAIARDLTARGAVCRVADAAQLASAARELLADSARRAALASAAQGWCRDNAGATARTLAAVRAELATP